jgi:hypothetical protein
MAFRYESTKPLRLQLIDSGMRRFQRRKRAHHHLDWT